MAKFRYCGDSEELGVFGVFALSLTSSLILTLFGLSVVALKGFVCNNWKSGAMNKTIARFSMLSICFNLFAGTAWYLRSLIEHHLICTLDESIPAVLYCAFTGLSYLSLYYIYCFRMVYTFRNTTYALSCSLVFLLKLMAFILAALMVAGGVSFEYLEYSKLWYVAPLLGGSFLVLYVVLSFVLFRLFRGKLSVMIGDFVAQYGHMSYSKFQDLVRNRRHRGRSRGGSKALEELEANMQSLGRLIRDASKYTTLLSLSMGATLLLLFTVLYCVWMQVKYGMEQFWILADFTFFVNLSVNSVCLALQFGFGSDVYSRRCGSCQTWWEGNITRGIDQKIGNMEAGQTAKTRRARNQRNEKYEKTAKSSNEEEESAFLSNGVNGFGGEEETLGHGLGWGLDETTINRNIFNLVANAQEVLT